MSLTLKEYVEGLVEFLKDNPETADYIVVTSKDDEGNGYNTVWQTPVIGCYDPELEFHTKSYYDDMEDDDDDDEDAGFLPSFFPNAVCVN